eukprot:GHVU01011998.1.p1 GENE.GHVU01011998.1~~GHVU01011998.1.p1  ORF type:complete len:163 (-),score=18.07 GHVU01011998.1:159-647(-)
MADDFPFPTVQCGKPIMIQEIFNIWSSGFVESQLCGSGVRVTGVLEAVDDEWMLISEHHQTYALLVERSIATLVKDVPKTREHILFIGEMRLLENPGAEIISRLWKKRIHSQGALDLDMQEGDIKIPSNVCLVPRICKIVEGYDEKTNWRALSLRRHIDLLS